MLIPKLSHKLKNKLINTTKLPPRNLSVKNKTTKGNIQSVLNRLV
jgi:hypothetical protein